MWSKNDRQGQMNVACGVGLMMYSSELLVNLVFLVFYCCPQMTKRHGDGRPDDDDDNIAMIFDKHTTHTTMRLS